jgi:hypothetical protein
MHAIYRTADILKLLQTFLSFCKGAKVGVTTHLLATLVSNYKKADLLAVVAWY